MPRPSGSALRATSWSSCRGAGARLKRGEKDVLTRRNLLQAAAMAAMTMLAGCSGARGDGADDAVTPDQAAPVAGTPAGDAPAAPGAVLVAYFSATGNTEEIASAVAERLGARGLPLARLHADAGGGVADSGRRPSRPRGLLAPLVAHGLAVDSVRAARATGGAGGCPEPRARLGEKNRACGAGHRRGGWLPRVSRTLRALIPCAWRGLSPGVAHDLAISPPGGSRGTGSPRARASRRASTPRR